MCTGGYGYGVSGHEINGGFGVGLSDFESDTGIGGIKFTDAWTGQTASYLIVTEELNLETGLAVLPWFMPVFYAGYQVMGNVGPGKPFQDFFSYTPVFGVRFAFGKF